MSMPDPKKILIVRFSSIGDVILASPFIRVMRSRFPKAQIDFVVKSEYAELVKFNHHLSSVIELKTPDPGELMALRKKIQGGGYDVIFDLHNSLRSRYLRAFSSATSVSVVQKHALARFLLITFKWNTYKAAVPIADRYFGTAQTFGVRNDDKGLEIFIPDESLFSVSSMMAKHRLDRYNSVLGIAPAANHTTKMWLQERFAEVAVEAVRARQAKIFIFGGQEDLQRCNEIASSINSSASMEAAVSFAGKLTLLETAAALDFCDVVLCNDTGIMHLAAARQRNVVAIFGPTVQEFGFFPYGTRAEVIEHNDLPCRPCTHIGSENCPQGHFRCMKDTTVDRVLRALTSMMAHQQISV